MVERLLNTHTHALACFAWKMQIRDTDVVSSNKDL